MTLKIEGKGKHVRFEIPSGTLRFVREVTIGDVGDNVVKIVSPGVEVVDGSHKIYATTYRLSGRVVVGKVVPKRKMLESGE